jgi:gliding motility-associated protein GldM
MASNNPNSPRQKMINLMYLVFIAMLALNIPSEVLDGFELVEESLLRSVKASSQRNDRVFSDLGDYFKTNPEKTKVWYESAEQVKEETDSLFDYIQNLKLRIVQKADGKGSNLEHLKHPDDLNAAYDVTFEPGKNDGTKLKLSINSYREFISSLVQNPSIKNIIENNLSTEPSLKAKANKQSWEESMFLNMPVAATITLLTKLQNDIRYAEGEVLSDLLKNIDIEDVRVNKVEAFVIPESQIVMRGTPYRANIVLSAQDTTQKPRVFVNGKYLPEESNGQYVAGTGATGVFPVSGFIELARGDGGFLRRDFSTQYFVNEPSVTVAPILMNVLYAGYENEISIAAPGIVSQNISAGITNGTLTHKANDIWVAKPAKVGEEAFITVTAKMPDGRTLEMGRKSFRVRALPDPSAYLSVTDPNGNSVKFDGGPLSKAALVNVEVAKAAIDDGILSIPFTVLRFELVSTDAMGYNTTEVSDGSRFSERQKAMIRNFARGKRAYIRGVVTKGPDGIERPPLKAPLEIIIN